ATPVSANRTLALLSNLINYAVEKGERPEGPNPCRTGRGPGRVKKYAERRRERLLSTDELARLGAAILEAETTGIPWSPNPRGKTRHAPKEPNRCVVIGAPAAAAIRLLLFTGARLREILDLRWEHVDFERGLLLLPDSKTGKKTIVLN